MTEHCIECGNVISKKIGVHYYNGSGLRNLFIENVPVYECSCGVSYPSIFRLFRLNQIIGGRLIEKTTLLTGEEIRFLRKSVRMSATDFANLIGVEKTTLSKWENNSQTHRESYDRLIRIVYMGLKGIRPAKQKQVLSMLKKIKLSKQEVPHVLIAARTGDDYQVQWRIVAETYVEKGQNVWIKPEDFTYTTRRAIALHEMADFYEKAVDAQAQKSFFEI